MNPNAKKEKKEGKDKRKKERKNYYKQILNHAIQST